MTMCVLLQSTPILLFWMHTGVLTYWCQQVRKFVIRREVKPKGEDKKPYTKAPKIQRLVTPQRLQHKRRRIALKRRQAERVKDAAVSFSSSYTSPPVHLYLYADDPNADRIRLHPLQACQRREVQAKRAAQEEGQFDEEIDTWTWRSSGGRRGGSETQFRKRSAVRNGRLVVAVVQ